ncbi:MAG: acyl-CoA synthetase FdrA [Candidatus Neomarinimicrobiota bacterium]|nr:acyl-CoA synthetase FdrA [Candidatus Neomarinimicrobiota bacterium]
MGKSVISHVIPKTYQDSVRLMQVSEQLSNLDAVQRTFVAMGTDANKRVLDQIGLLTKTVNKAGANDLIFVVEADSKDVAKGALVQAKTLLSGRKKKANNGSRLEPLPKTFEQAHKGFTEANMMFISVPGPYASYEASKALNANMNVMLFSDHISIQDELSLKKLAVQKGLLLMGPGCGTAVINGIALGFANVLERGPVGIIGASGTGLQELTTLLDRGGVGTSQVIGVGGRDLSDTIGGTMMRQGISMLSSDPNTELIVLISKPPAITVADKILENARSSNKPVIVNFLGEDKVRKQDGIIFTKTIEDTSEAVLALIRKRSGPFLATNSDTLIKMAEDEREQLAKSQKYIRGLFAGGSLCDEATDVLVEYFQGIYSNVSVSKKWALKNGRISKQHSCIDMGEEEFTQSRPHPMIDLSLRQERIIVEASDPSVAVILLDVVIGYGAHDNPAPKLSETIRKAKDNAVANKRYLSVVAHVCGSEKDPQGLHKQEESLRDAGVLVLPTNAQAAKVAAAVVGAKLK